MIRKIITLGNETLRMTSKPMQKFDLRLWLLLRDMAETMYDADGVGLAAPQVGILRRVVVIDIGEGLVELINPEIIYTEGEQAGAEGCLSVPGRRGFVRRPNKVTVRALDRKGKPFEIVIVVIRVLGSRSRPLFRSGVIGDAVIVGGCVRIGHGVQRDLIPLIIRARGVLHFNGGGGIGGM